MAVFYRVYQNNNENFVNKGKWYARATMTETVDMKKLAERIQRNCTAKKSDVWAVLTELVEVMQDELQASHRVKLDGFGAFKIGIQSKASDTVKDFNAAKHVKGLRIIFQPETKISADKTRTRTFLTGCTVQEAPKNAIEA